MALRLKSLFPGKSRSGNAKPAGRRRGIGDVTRGRVVFAKGAFALVYVVIAGRLVLLGFAQEPKPLMAPASEIAAARPDILDRNGVILATDIKTASLFAEPRRIVDPDEASEKLATVFPDLGDEKVRKRLASNAGFQWLRRELTPEQRDKVFNLGLPGIGFVSENKRFYPAGNSTAYVTGHVNIDNKGIAGIEKYIDDQWLGDLHQLGFASTPNLEPITLSLDARVQHVVHDEISQAMERYHAIAAAGIVLDAHTGEVIAMTSVPDYDPNDPAQALDPNRLNRSSAAVYEMGSTFKLFTTAMALDDGAIKITDTIDASKPLRVSGRTIHDFHGKYRPLSVPEVFIYSSNIGTAHEAMRVGVDGQKDFLGRIGLLDKVQTELPEIAAPLLPRRWTELTGITVSFGHGISVSPLATAVAAAAIMNGGYLIEPTFFPRSRQEAQAMAKRVVNERTSKEMRYLMRLNVEDRRGSGKRADVPGYFVGGKTGTAEKVVNGRYSNDKRRNAFLAAFPIDDPDYIVLVVLDEPQKEEGAYSAVAGLNAAPTVGNIIRRAAPMLGVMPRYNSDIDRLIDASF
ncbi:Peptidoglycan synthase FtsI [Hartmannibacter diazotrophicus]|uniref:Peptidoglycan synthase FtsI n=1 Tax=Hartmannibacter diazotrophicus TaxID=1482074 RepID=A0A2C9D8F5_9HYPH|nr:penicillin-binding protein 2 [Hartmannibacter diazotrophicus]SON56523.1 Peptidoglycan synthase FtsI [Hartmannibacter diazotrophicus]